MGIILLLLLSSIPPFQAAAADVFCGNVKVVAATLVNKTSSSPTHFATVTFGDAPDVVYALALCRGDILDDSTCADAVTNTFRKVQNLTPPEMECLKGFSAYYADCIFIYNAINLLAASPNTVGSYEDGGRPFQRWNVKNVTGDIPLITGLIHDLRVETAEKAANATPKRFATGVLDSGTSFPKIYSLSQCTPDLSAGDCLACLRRLLGMINSTMALRMGGQMAVVRCYFRFDASKFYEGEPMITLGAPSPAPAPAEHKSKSSTNK
ncbi:hypothetical protein QYE76_062340 [Lolium multiflorum]|uniref:Gnk2-homologous domain-containing protein n=1 Tax=Lolium multiflorum TaxID=4521 RepID=A0AAD8S539_LOLMU|nr:hypothetical protein QYE76_062340 [Lolium multiflorum]